MPSGFVYIPILQTAPCTPSITQTQGHFSQTRIDDTQRLISRYLHEERISPDDARLISEFIAERRAAGGISPRRADKLAYTLLGWRRFIPEVATLTLGSVYTGIKAIKHAEHRFGRPFKQNTLFDHVAILKQFLLWMIENEYSDLPREENQSHQDPEERSEDQDRIAALHPR
jgi:integrase/recombinase XerD